MNNPSKPRITVKRKAQKGSYTFSEILTKDILSDVCQRLTGQNKYTVKYDDVGYNRGRLAMIEFNETKIYVSFSEHGKVSGRNSFFQSLTTAFSNYYSDPHPNKRIVFYFLPTIKGSFDSPYFQFMYRLMATNGVEFLNADAFLGKNVIEFKTIDDIIEARNTNKGLNSSNNPTYITRSTKNITQIYGKTYGANKKESTLLCLAAAQLSQKVELYEIGEGNLQTLPAPDKKTLEKKGNIYIISTNKKLERQDFNTTVTFRSPTFIYNLFQKFQKKECAFCACAVPDIIAGAHVWPVADIKRANMISDEEKLLKATDGENGLWLCYNHHKLFDENLIYISNSGKIMHNTINNSNYIHFIRHITTKKTIPSHALTDTFVEYLDRRKKSMKSL
jgi:hypothetical protein